MGKVEVKIKNKSDFKPININIDITIESLQEFTELKENLNELLQDWSFSSVILDSLVAELRTI